MHTLREGAGPGLHRLTATDPAARALEVADELDGRVCSTAAELEVVLADAAPVARLDDAALADLGRVARRWASLSRTAERTRQRVVTAAGHRLAPGALAVHPETVRERAQRLEAARAELLAAERALAAHDAAVLGAEEPDPGPEGDGVLSADSERRAGTAAARLRARRNQALGAVLASFGLGLVLFALGVLPLWAALLIPFLASLWALRHLRPVEPEPPDDDGPSLLSEVGAYTDELFGTRRAAEEHEVERARLDVDRSRAEEEVRLAERAWTDLAGAGVDPRDVEDVVRRFNPGLGGAEALVGESVGVRAAETALARLVEGWADRWASFGLPAPSIADGATALRDLAARRAQPIVLVGEAATRGEEVAAMMPSAPVVVVEAEAPDPAP